MQITPTILHDDPLTSVSFQIKDQPPVELTAEPYSFTIDPLKLVPGDYTLTVSATDNRRRDTGAAVMNFSVAALPSQITLSPDLSTLGAISTPQTITVQATGTNAAQFGLGRFQRQRRAHRPHRAVYLHHRPAAIPTRR